MFSSNTSQVSTVANWIEDCFSCFLYTGNASTQTITNGIDLSTKGGLVWIKSRSAGYGHYIFDTNRGALNRLASNGTGAESSISNSLTSFLSNGFSLGSEIGVNESPGNYASWTFRKQPKFFDVVTYTGDGNSNRTVSHSLGSTPGCIIIKRTNVSTSWIVWHRGDGTTNYNALSLNATDGSTASVAAGDLPTSTTFKPSALLGADYLNGNANGGAYVAYLFAHNAGGFGLTGTDNVISCGSYTGNSGAQSISLGYEPQWLLVKNASSTADWVMYDNMRGIGAPSQAPQRLFPNTSGFESAGTFIGINATGFMLDNAGSQTNASGNTYIYIAIRRGPMKTPTTGTSVFSPTTASSEPQSTPLLTGGSFPSDMVLHRPRYTLTSYGFYNTGRLTGGGTSTLETFSTVAAYDFGSPPYWKFDNSTAAYIPANGYFNNNGEGNIGYALYSFRRAPGFFDVVCYTGTGSSSTSFSHNLGVAPELIISKTRSGSTSNWIVTSNFTSTNYLLTALNLTIAGDTFLYTADASISAQPTSTTLKFTGGVPAVNDSGATYVAYLFASCPGVSKVTNFTGTGALQTINCGFTGGARLVLIKRTDASGDWYIWDSSRGLSSSNDPYLLLNSTAAEVTTTNWVDTTSTGFQVTAAAGNNVNINGASYIALAIA